MAKKKSIGFIKPKKIWQKVFSEGEIESVWAMFLDLFEDISGKKIDWSKESYLDFISGDFNNKLFPVYPETDIRDNSEGIQPKQLKRLLQIIDLDSVYLLFKSMSTLTRHYCAQGEGFWDREDTFVSWKEIFKKHLDPILKEESSNEEKQIKFGKIIFDSKFKQNGLGYSNFQGNKILFYSNIDNSLYHGLVTKIKDQDSSIVKIQDIVDFFELKLVPKDTTITSELVLNVDSFFDDMKENWSKTQSFIPKHKSVLLLNPEYWNKQVFLNSMFQLFGVRQIDKLSDKDSQFFLDLYKTFGVYLLDIVPFIKNEQMISISNEMFFTYQSHSSVSKAFTKLLSVLSRGIDIQLPVLDLYFIINSFLIESTDKVINSKSRVTIKDIRSLVSAGKFAVKMIKSNKGIIKNIPFEYLSHFERYNISSRDMEEVFKIYSETKDIPLKGIPSFTGTIGNYKYEVLSKKDLRWLIAGNATNCCQHISGTGKEFIYEGSKKDNVAIFLVTKGEKIIAQSLLWSVKGQLTFDSMEFLGGNNSKDVADCYRAYIKEASEESKIKRITVGSKGGLYNEFKEAPAATKFEMSPISKNYDSTNQYILYEEG